MWQSIVVMVTLLIGASGVGVADTSNGNDGGFLTCTNPGHPDPVPTGGGVAGATIRPGEVHYWHVPLEPDADMAFFDGVVEGGSVDVAMADLNRSWGPADPCEPPCTFGFLDVPLQAIQQPSGGCSVEEDGAPLLLVTLRTLAPGIDAPHYQFHVGSCSMHVYGVALVGHHCAAP